MSSARPLALLLENIHPEAARILGSKGFEVETVTTALSEDELCERISNVVLLGSRSKTQITEKVLDNAPNLVALGAFCIGTDQINISAASARGIAVFNAPYSNTRSVVELAMAEIISLARRLTEKTEQMHQGVWNKSAVGAHEVRGQTLGIVGYGNIGSQLSVIAEAMGMHVIFYDTADKLALGNARRCSDMDQLLRSADFVSLHVDGRSSNRRFFGEEQFARMKPGAMFLNLCRGFVIDHEALAANLKSGHVGGAAVDVFMDEPAGKSKEFNSVLRGIPNVILTPHIGGSTEEAQDDIGHFVANKLSDYASDGATDLSVNMPIVAPSTCESTHRIAHLHRNIPGVIAEINSLFAERSINVEQQNLATRNDLGYAITDVSLDSAPDELEALALELTKLPATVKLRVIKDGAPA
jgi:D-3-phosphoglycerate dehydrogenase / 2-oxoglutarate reductase